MSRVFDSQALPKVQTENSSRPRLIAVSGGSGSGKTTLVGRVLEALPKADVLTLQMDHYYLDLAHLSPAERDRRNFDHPDAFDKDLLREQLAELLAGRSVQRPTYDFATHTRKDPPVTIAPRQILLLDGILALHDPKLRQLCDLTVYVDVDDDMRFIRRLRRDVAERGRTVEKVIDQYLSSVKAMHDLYVAPQKQVADIIVSWMDYNDRAVAMLAGMVHSWLAATRAAGVSGG